MLKNVEARRMLKSLRIKIVFFSLIICLVSSLLLGGCGRAIGSFNTINELYENKSITRQDVMNIAALRTGSVEVIKDITKKPWELEEVAFDSAAPVTQLSEAVQKKIKQEFSTVKKEKHKAELYDYNLVKYYGTYGGLIVVEISCKMVGLDVATDMMELSVSDIYLGQISASSEIVAWREKN